MEKVISFDDYKLAKVIYPEYSYSQLFDTAWSNTEQGIKYNKNKKNIIKFCSIAGLMIVSFGILTHFTMVNAHASDLLDVKMLKIEEPKLWEKIQSIANTFVENQQGLDLSQSEDLVYILSKRGLSPTEFTKVKSIYEGLSSEDIRKVVTMLAPTLLP